MDMDTDINKAKKRFRKRIGLPISKSRISHYTGTAFLQCK